MVNISSGSCKAEDNYLKYIVPEDKSGLTIGEILKKELGFSSRKLSSVKFAEKGIMLDGERARVSARAGSGQIIRIPVWDSERRSFHIDPVETDIKILYEDEFYLAVDKPAGIVSHPSRGHYHDSAANGVQFYLQKNDCRNNAHLLGRLDKDTTGVLLFSKSGYGKERFLALPEGHVTKEYIAIAEGVMEYDEGSITIPMREFRDEDTGFLRMIQWMPGDDPHERMDAVTEYKILCRHDDHQIAGLILKTGRMHQIRFHMAASGCPLLGDPVYGEPSELIGRTALHCKRMTYTHPFYGERVEIMSPVPEDMRRFIH